MEATETDWRSFENSMFDERWFVALWLVAVATYGVGDIVTTIAMVYFTDLYTESNPLIRSAIETFGGGGFLGLKLLVFNVCIGISIWAGKQADDWLMFYGPPSLLAVLGLWMTWLNLGLLLG